MDIDTFAILINTIIKEKRWVKNLPPLKNNEEIIGEMDDYEKAIFSFIWEQIEEGEKIKKSTEDFKIFCKLQNIKENIEFADNILKGLIYIHLKVDFKKEIRFREDFKIVIIPKNKLEKIIEDQLKDLSGFFSKN